MSLPSLSALDICLLSFGIILLLKLWSRQRTTRLPPGPKGYPIIGNLLDMPTEKEWDTFAKWGEAWGDLCSVTIFGQPLIIVNSYQMAVELMDKKSAIYSDRPVLQMAGELCGWKNTLGLTPYGERYRSYRKLFHQLFGSQTSMKRFYPVEELETRRFLRRLLKTPDNFLAHIRHTAAAIILHITYGYEIKNEGDRFISLVDEAMEQFAIGSSPGGFLVDLLPILRFVPSWFPGATFKATAEVWANTLLATINGPFDYVKQAMAAGTAEDSFVSIILNDVETAAEEANLKWAAGSIYAGGADTSVASIDSFFVAMALHPDVQAKAQEEIDTVIGNDRLPSFADRDRLPYVEALCKEVLRYHTVAPTGIPHRAMEDDVTEGYLIPKGSMVIPNIWQMLHDPRTYTNPMKFDPTRYLPSGTKVPELDPREICFGFGRRICPGKTLAEASVFITCAMTLAVFNISKAVENGVVIEPVHGQATGTVSHPTPFKCSIKPRSEKAVGLITALEES